MKFRTLLALGLALAGLNGTGAYAASEAALVEAGRRIYEQGILPDGTPLSAQRPEGFTLEGAHAACTTCHRRSGMGSVEGQVERIVMVVPIAGPVLFKPAKFANSFLDPSHHYVPNKAWQRALTRPAYDEKSLARALREGVDPAGRPLSPPMMRYALDDKAVSALAAYLRQLNSQPSPGLGRDGSLQVATVITPDVPAARAEAVLGVVRAWLRSIRPLGRPIRLHEWRLTGEAGDWPSQLADFYRQQPVFALVSGVGGARWQPVQAFCEAQTLPCLLPSVEVAPDNDTRGAGQTAYYSVYYSPGLTLEARLLAHYLKDQTKKRTPGLVQIYSDDSGRIAAQTARAQVPLGGQDRRLRLTSPSSALTGLSAQDAVMLWLRPDEIEQLVSTRAEPPAGQVYLSALLAPPGSVALPLAWKRRVAYVSLFDDLSVQGEIARVRLQHWLQQHHLPVGTRELRLQADAYAACYLFNAALSRIRAQEVRRPAVPLSGEQVLEMLETLTDKYSDGTEQVDPDSHVAFYGRMSLGPQQRYAVRGGNIQRYAAPDYVRLVAEGGRIVP